MDPGLRRDDDAFVLCYQDFMISCAFKSLSRPAPVLGFVALMSFAALAVAVTSELAFGLEPCIMCVYQRAPFALAIVLGLAGLALRKFDRFAYAMVGLCALAFLVNSGMAVYHSGIEQHWWESAVEGCKVPQLSEGGENWIDNLMAMPSVSCTDIQWKDPVLGLTMANYNIVLNLMLFAVCAFALILTRCPSGTEHQKQP